MKVITTNIEGVLIIDGYKAYDDRGTFFKIFNDDDFIKENISFDIKESYYSISKKNVIRGMHFQTHPKEHDKLVSVITGAIIDVVIDLRKGCKSYKNIISVKLDSLSNKSIYIPKGCAHGFLSLENNTIVLYNVTSGYSPNNDCGVRWDSIGYNWGVDKPIISDRDKGFDKLDNFDSPF